jgi:hypothetical protein
VQRWLWYPQFGNSIPLQSTEDFAMSKHVSRVVAALILAAGINLEAESR